MTATSQVLIALANLERMHVMRLLTTASAPLPVATLSKLLGRTPRDVRQILRGLERACVIADRGGAVGRTAAFEVALEALWLELTSSCCSQPVFAHAPRADNTSL